MSSDIFFIAGIMVITLLALMMVMATLYRKAGPHEALIVYGFRGTRIVKGRGTVIFPMIENFRQLSLQLMSFDVAPQQSVKGSLPPGQYVIAWKPDNGQPEQFNYSSNQGPFNWTFCGKP